MISKGIRKLMDSDSAIRRIWTEGRELKQLHGAENVADMTLGNPFASPPQALLEVLEEMVANPPPDLHLYTLTAGHPEVRARIAADLDESGVLSGARPEHVVVTAGASAATNIVLRAILEPGDEVILLAPYFPDYPAHVSNHQGVPCPVGTRDDFLPDLEAIQRALGPKTRALILNHPKMGTDRP